MQLNLRKSSKSGKRGAPLIVILFSQYSHSSNIPIYSPDAISFQWVNLLAISLSCACFTGRKKMKETILKWTT